MTGAGSDDALPISLVIPGRPEYVALGRLVAGGIAASIADLKLIVTEACTLFMYGPGGTQPGQTGQEEAPSSIQLEFAVTPAAWQIVVSDPERRHRLAGLTSADPMSEGGLGLTIIKALVDSVEYTETETEGSVIRLVKRFPSSAGIDI